MACLPPALKVDFVESEKPTALCLDSRQTLVPFTWPRLLPPGGPPELNSVHATLVYATMLNGMAP